MREISSILTIILSLALVSACESSSLQELQQKPTGGNDAGSQEWGEDEDAWTGGSGDVEAKVDSSEESKPSLDTTRDKPGRPDGSGSSIIECPGDNCSDTEESRNKRGEKIVELIEKAARRAPQVGNSKFDSGPWWKKHWGDDFEGPKSGEDDYCYNDVKPRCMMNYWLGTPCEETYTVRDNLPQIKDNLDDLNKCVWSVYAKDQGKTPISSFDPSLVSVENSKLLLKTKSVKKDNYDCGNPGNYKDTQWSHGTTNCPFRVGGVESREFGAKGRKGKGYIETYGRFEVRGRLHDGPGRSPGPAYWLLTNRGVWPYDGEIDIMEVWGKRWPSQYSANYHGGDRAIRSSQEKAPGHTDSAATLKRNVTVKPTKNYGDTFYDDFNTYAIEWSPDKIEYYFNNIKLGEVNAGEGEYRDDLKMCLPLNIPDDPMFFILDNQIQQTSQTIGDGWPGNDLQEAVEEYETRTHEIDHARTFKRCKNDSDFCPWGGTFNGLNCAVIAVPDGVQHQIQNGRLTYQPDSSDGCPKGGYRDGGRCVLQTVPESANPFVRDDILYTKSACVESTLSSYCSNPCKGIGHYDGYRCVVGSIPDSMKGDIENGEFRYENSGFLSGGTEEGQCRSGDEFLGSSEGCLFADVPEGRQPGIEDDKFYVDPVCSTTAPLMNCPKPCKWGGEFDGRNCHVKTVPESAGPFIHNRGFYYASQQDQSDERCPYGGHYDGRNCYLDFRAPEGSNPFIQDGAFYIGPRCDHSLDLQNMKENVFKTSEAEVCEPENYPSEPIVYRAHVRFNGWSDWKGQRSMVGEEDAGAMNRLQGLQFHLPWNQIQAPDSVIEKLKKRTIKCKAHVGGKGWLDWAKGSDKCGKQGTFGRRLEAIKLKLTAAKNGEPPTASQSIVYRVYVKDDGWTDWKRDGAVAGTTGDNKRIEAVEVKLEGF